MAPTPISSPTCTPFGGGEGAMEWPGDFQTLPICKMKVLYMTF